MLAKKSWKILGSQTWLCDPNGRFNTTTPNRENCLEDWIPDLDNQINDTHTLSIDVSEELEENLKNEEGDLSSTGLVYLASLLDRLLLKRSREVDSGLAENDTNEFFQSFLTNVDSLVSFDKSWANLESNSGYETTEILLGNIADAAQLHLNSSDDGIY